MINVERQCKWQSRQRWMPHSCHSLGPFMGGMTETWKPFSLHSLSDGVNCKLFQLFVFNLASWVCLTFSTHSWSYITGPHCTWWVSLHVQTYSWSMSIWACSQECFHLSHYHWVVDSGQPPDGRAANINSSPQFREGSSLKHPHLLLSCNIVKHVEHFLSQSCFHRHQDSGSIVSSGFCGEHDPVWPYRELTQAHSLKIEIEYFSPL